MQKPSKTSNPSKNLKEIIAAQLGTVTAKNSVEAKKKLFYITEIAGTYFRQDNYSEAERYLTMAMALLPMIPEADLSSDARANQSTLLSIYWAKAFTARTAIKMQSSLTDGIRRGAKIAQCFLRISKMLLGSLGGCYDQLKQFDKSAPIYRGMAMLDRNYFGDTDLNYGWSLLELSDSLKAQGKKAEAAPLFEKAVWIFRDDNCRRLAEKYGVDERQLKDEEAGGIASPEKIQQDKKLAAILRSTVFGLGDTLEKKVGDKDLAQPGTELATLFDHCQAPKRGKLGAWNVKPVKHTDAPGWVWADPRVPQKALMLCVPGLGLHHRAFQSFAERIVDQGFTVVSFDVRGFGAYMQSKGHDHLDMNACLNDLISIIGLIRRDYKGKPVFLLGESMGGALALRVVADQPDLVDGLVCSVPAAERHQETGTKLKIGLKLLTRPQQTGKFSPYGGG